MNIFCYYGNDLVILAPNFYFFYGSYIMKADLEERVRNNGYMFLYMSLTEIVSGNS